MYYQMGDAVTATPARLSRLGVRAGGSDRVRIIADAAHTASQAGRFLRANIGVRAGITRMHEKLCIIANRIEIPGTSV